MDQRLLEYFNGDELAAEVWLAKYAAGGEVTPDDMHRRLAKEFARIEEGYIETESDRSDLSEYGRSRENLTEEKIYELFKDFDFISPQGSVLATLGTDVISSLSNCVVIPEPEDSIGSILWTDQELSQLYKRRCGVGTGISGLRPRNAGTSNSAKSSTGAVSFMERFSNTTREIAQSGRRGALMCTIDIRHPDVPEFIEIKKDRTKVTGANISIKVRDDFMQAVTNDGDYILRFPCNIEIGSDRVVTLEYGKLIEIYPQVYIRKVKAKELWDQIIQAAWDSAEPGVLFSDSIVDYSPDGVFLQYCPVNPNPCGEQNLDNYNTCRLIFCNLFNFVDNPFRSDAKIDYKKVYEMFYEQTRLGDDLVDLEIEYIDRIISKIEFDPESDQVKLVELTLWNNLKEKAINSRRVGCGITGLGDMLAALDLKYDSADGLYAVEQVMKVKMQAELDCLIDLAILRGQFHGWDQFKAFLWDHYDGEMQFTGIGSNRFYQMLCDEFPDQVKRMLKYGLRCVSWSTIAPVGTGSIMTQTTSGCEPLFLPFYIRRRKINPSDQNVRVDFTDQNGDKWQEYFVLHPKFRDYLFIVNEKFENGGIPRLNIQWKGITDPSTWTEEVLMEAFKHSPWYESTANDIDWQKRVEMQSILQKYTSNAISSTINLPNDVSAQVVNDIYLKAHELGLKGVTVYRDGCRTGVLVNKKNELTFSQHDAVKRPKKLDCEIHVVSVKGTKYNVIVGMLEGKPYEVFAHLHSGVNVSKGPGIIIKDAKSKYRYGSDRFEDVVVTNDMTDEQAAITRLISTGLRHGVNIKFLTDQIDKTDGDLTSFTKAISRVLKKYVEDGESSSESCPDCQSKLIFSEGCKKCLTCGYSACN